MTKCHRTPSKPLLTDENQPLQRRPVKRHDPAQPHVPFDPIPPRIEPCLAGLRGQPPAESDRSWKIKWGGYRLAAHIEPSGVRLITSGGHDWPHRFAAIAESARALGPTTMIVDAKLSSSMSKAGRISIPTSDRLVPRQDGGKLLSSNFSLYVFDLLYVNGYDLRSMDYNTRRKLLEDVLEGDGAILVSEQVNVNPEPLVAQASSLGLEGIVGKHRGHRHQPGRTGDWVKVKRVQSESSWPSATSPSTALHGPVGSLLLGAHNGESIAYVGFV